MPLTPAFGAGVQVTAITRQWLPASPTRHRQHTLTLLPSRPLCVSVYVQYSFWAGWLTSADKTVSVWPQMSIVAMQSLLLFMFWLNIVSMEEQLVPLNKVIEASPGSAKVRLGL